jgi:hypothetical protein
VVEDHLTVDVDAADFLVDLSNVVRNTELPGGLARLGRFAELLGALTRFAGDPSAQVYAVLDRAVLHQRQLPGSAPDVLLTFREPHPFSHPIRG